MTGVILCGGLSSRMGADKGSLELHEKKWAQIIANKFTQLNLPFVIAINARQKDVYQLIFDPKQLIIDDAILNAKGPLLGLITVHKQLPKEDLFVIACDMIDMELPPLQLLIDKCNLKEKFDAYLFEINKELQPVCTIYATSFLTVISNKIKNNELKRFSLKELFKDFNNYIATPPTEWLRYFTNYNSQEDLNRFNKQA